MSANFLQLNESKTEVLLFGSPASTEAVASKLGPLSGNLHSHVRNLGVTFDSALTFDKQINAVVRSCFYQLKGWLTGFFLGLIVFMGCSLACVHACFF